MKLFFTFKSLHRCISTAGSEKDASTNQHILDPTTEIGIAHQTAHDQAEYTNKEADHYTADTAGNGT